MKILNKIDSTCKPLKAGISSITQNTEQNFSAGKTWPQTVEGKADSHTANPSTSTCLTTTLLNLKMTLWAWKTRLEIMSTIKGRNGNFTSCVVNGLRRHTHNTYSSFLWIKSSSALGKLMAEKSSLFSLSCSQQIVASGALLELSLSPFHPTPPRHQLWISNSWGQLRCRERGWMAHSLPHTCFES